MLRCADERACESLLSINPPVMNPFSGKPFGADPTTLEKWRADCRAGRARVAHFADCGNGGLARACEQWKKYGRSPYTGLPVKRRTVIGQRLDQECGVPEKRKGDAGQPEEKRPRIDSPWDPKASRLQDRLRGIFQRAQRGVVPNQNPGPHELPRDPYTPATNPLVPSPPQPTDTTAWPARINSVLRGGLPEVRQEQVHKGKAMVQPGAGGSQPKEITHAHRCILEQDPRVMVEKATWTEKEFRWLKQLRAHASAKSGGLTPAPSPWDSTGETKHDVDSLSHEALIGSVLRQLPKDGGQHHFLFPAYVQRRPSAKLVDPKSGKAVGTMKQYGIYTPFAAGHSYQTIALNGWTDAANQYHDPLDGDESLTVQLQVAFAIAIMHQRAQVIHTDLHSNNGLVQKLPQPASFQYVVHGADGTQRSFAFWSRYHVVLFDWDRAVFVPVAPLLDKSDLCMDYGQCQSERTYVVDEYKFWSSPAPKAPVHRYVADYVVPLKELRPEDSLYHFLCFGHYAANATAPDTNCTRCTPTSIMVQDTLSVILDPGSPFAKFRAAFTYSPQYMTNVYQYGDSRDPTQPVCSPSIWNKPRRALTP